MTPDTAEHRVLVLAPLGKDAALISRILGEASVPCKACRDVHELVTEVRAGAGAIVIAEEAFGFEDPLARWIDEQPAWSDMPVLVLTRHGSASEQVLHALKYLGNVTLLERPVRIRWLLSAINTALRARNRQYQIRQQLIEREQQSQRKDQFLATLAHELRNPLAPIRNSLSIMRITSDEHARSLTQAVIERQVDLMVHLVDDLIDVSRLTRGAIQLRTEPLDLARPITAAIETSRPLIEAAHHRFVLTLPRQPMMVSGDPTRLAQIFANLLNNAAKYTNRGGTISLNAETRDDTAVVTIRDNGIGIAPTVLPNVFDMFMQADAADNRTQIGLGIGLTLVKSFTEMHGGLVTADSPGVDKGSVFTVRLPLLRELAAAGETSAPQASALHDGTRVVVVDDNRDSADTLATLLRLRHADVRIAYDGPSGLDLIADFRPDVVILDLGMPGMDGYEVARRLRARDHGPMRIVALTGWGQEKDREQTRQAGFDHHLVKPVDLQAIEAVLKE